MEIVVAFEEAGAGGCDDRLEEDSRTSFGSYTHTRGTKAGEEAFEEAELVDHEQHEKHDPLGLHTCQTKGRLLRFNKAKMIKITFHKPTCR